MLRIKDLVRFGSRPARAARCFRNRAARPGINLGIWLRGVGGFDTVDLGKSIVFVVPVVVAGSGGVVACGNHELDDSLALVHYGVEMVRYAGCLAAFSVDAASLAISVVVIDANVVIGTSQ